MAKYPPASLLAYTDGRCPFCQWSRRQVEQRDKAGAIEFRDYNEPALARETPYSDEELAREMHARTADGRWFGGFFAWIQVLEALPRWRWLGKLLSWPPFRWMGPPVYRLIARNRYRAPGFVLSWMGAPRPCTPEGVCRVADPLEGNVDRISVKH